VAVAAAPKKLANPDIRRRLARLTVGDYPHQPTADSGVVETYTLLCIGLQLFRQRLGDTIAFSRRSRRRPITVKRYSHVIHLR